MTVASLSFRALVPRAKLGAVDVEIVGAGFAGLTCARVCAERGLDTVVWERKRDPGRPVHTTGLLVREVADDEGTSLAHTKKIRGVRLYAPSLRWIDLDAPGYYFLATDTPAFLRSLARRAAEAGADVRCGRAAPPRSGRILVGADGARSGVARAAGLGRNRHFLSGVEAEFVGVRGVAERLHVFLDSDVAPGYIGWVVPGLGVTQVGLASRRPASQVGTRGGLIPVGGRVRPVASRDVALVGDAAGLVCPLTAGGIHTAIGSGRAAGVAIAASLLDVGPPLDRALHSAYPRFGGKVALRRAMDFRPPNALVDLAFDSRPFRAAAQTVFFHHRMLLSSDAWRDIVFQPGAVFVASLLRTLTGTDRGSKVDPCGGSTFPRI